MAIYRDKLFPRMYDLLMSKGKLDSRRAGHLAQVNGDVMELGIGTGLNLSYYPSRINSLTGLDSSAGMLQQLEKKCQKLNYTLSTVLGTAERMSFEDESFDTVVSTHSLCSISDLPAALSEIKRVLRPDGKFVFLEHGLSSDQKVAKWQSRLNGLQKILAAGCQLNVAMDLEIKKAGFEILELNMGHHHGESKLTGFLYEGIAKK